MNLLLEAGAKVDEPPYHIYGATALQLAAIKGYLGIARHLTDLGADINARGAEIHGRTALESAAEHGRLEMVQLLLCRGAETTGAWRHQHIRSIAFAKIGENLVVESLLRDYREWTKTKTCGARATC
ncbi:ankyrin repeats (many copies) domain-containing protein [Hirsutella rhossiliensis]|uniref:Ankyrin repeats (Many copies) domain-containing protein n=1 Tax=Hirsutella rhossiliensis TaxID=111463 RepID=A0A9P8MV59_9HYPO|nr:ankyrin repeats (many copies) domain-containing protein [Hirsutella rhossiliensis]KAH0961734.1 ankyrin repeats (many copies) domain-containing protein [Hirsutella rhossiliensis]